MGRRQAGEVLVETTDVECRAENTTAEPIIVISAICSRNKLPSGGRGESVVRPAATVGRPPNTPRGGPPRDWYSNAQNESFYVRQPTFSPDGRRRGLQNDRFQPRESTFVLNVFKRRHAAR